MAKLGLELEALGDAQEAYNAAFERQQVGWQGGEGRAALAATQQEASEPLAFPPLGVGHTVHLSARISVAPLPQARPASSRVCCLPFVPQRAHRGHHRPPLRAARWRGRSTTTTHTASRCLYSNDGPGCAW